MKGQIAERYFKEGYNCAQAVVLAFIDEIGMEREAALRLSSPFGGGMGRLREVCGAVSGMWIVLGCLKGYSEPGNNKIKMELYSTVQMLAEKVKRVNGSIVCRELLSLPSGPDDPVPEKRTEGYYKKRPCGLIVANVAEILEEYLSGVNDD